MPKSKFRRALTPAQRVAAKLKCKELYNQLKDVPEKAFRPSYQLLDSMRDSYKVSAMHLALLRNECSATSPRFRKRVGLSYQPWYLHFYKPLAKHYNDYKEQTVTRRKRKSELPLLLRVYRFSLWLRGVKATTLVDKFHQSESTITKDCQLFSWLAAGKMSDKWIYFPLVGTQESRNLRGAGDFELVPDAFAAADIVMIYIRKPSNKLTECDWWAHDKKRHCVAMQLYVDGNGFIRSISGAVGGSIHDVTMFNSCELKDELDRYVSALVIALITQ